MEDASFYLDFVYGRDTAARKARLFVERNAETTRVSAPDSAITLVFQGEQLIGVERYRGPALPAPDKNRGPSNDVDDLINGITTKTPQTPREPPAHAEKGSPSRRPTVDGVIKIIVEEPEEDSEPAASSTLIETEAAAAAADT